MCEHERRIYNQPMTEFLCLDCLRYIAVKELMESTRIPQQFVNTFNTSGWSEPTRVEDEPGVPREAVDEECPCEDCTREGERVEAARPTAANNSAYQMLYNAYSNSWTSLGFDSSVTDE